MMDLLLDVKINIAKLYDETWIKLVLYDNEFKEFAYSTLGVAIYKQSIMMNIEPQIDQYGTKRWYYHSQLHRDNDLPAIVWTNGDQSWWVRGQRHRDNDLPAVVMTNGDQSWWSHGQRH